MLLICLTRGNSIFFPYLLKTLDNVQKSLLYCPYLMKNIKKKLLKPHGYILLLLLCHGTRFSSALTMNTVAKIFTRSFTNSIWIDLRRPGSHDISPHFPSAPYQQSGSFRFIFFATRGSEWHWYDGIIINNNYIIYIHIYMDGPRGTYGFVLSNLTLQ